MISRVVSTGGWSRGVSTRRISYRPGAIRDRSIVTARDVTYSARSGTSCHSSRSGDERVASLTFSAARRSHPPSARSIVRPTPITSPSGFTPYVSQYRPRGHRADTRVVVSARSIASARWYGAESLVVGANSNRSETSMRPPSARGRTPYRNRAALFELRSNSSRLRIIGCGREDATAGGGGGGARSTNHPVDVALESTAPIGGAIFAPAT